MKQNWEQRQHLGEKRCRVEASEPNHTCQSDMTKIWVGPAPGWAYLVSVIDCCTR